MLKIPKKFNICGRRVKILMKDNLIKHECILGKCLFDESLIILDNSLSGDILIETFYHELLHWIFYLLDEDDLNKNEQLINQMAALFNQFIKTRKY